MKCNTCNKEMIYFAEGQTCGWKCNLCGNIIVTTYDDGIDMDDSIYTICISSGNNVAAVNIKCAAKIIGCSFIEAKDFLISGKEINNLSAIQAREVLRILQSTDILYSITPEFTYDI